MKSQQAIEISLVDRNISRIPDWFLDKFAVSTETLDMSRNSVTTLIGLDKLPRLRHLILDCNGLEQPSLMTACYAPLLRTLSLNKNRFSDLKLLIAAIKLAFPRIRHLSLFGNPCCPDQLTRSVDVDGTDYARYRLYVISQLTFLEFLDCSKVTLQETIEARRIGKFQVVARPKIGLYRSTTDDPIPIGLHALPGTNDERTQNSNTPTDDTGHFYREPVRRRSAFGTRRSQYLGKHSEGNRFINDQQL